MTSRRSEQRRRARAKRIAHIREQQLKWVRADQAKRIRALFRVITVRPIGGGKLPAIEIVRQVAHRHLLDVVSVRSAGRQSLLVRARQEAMYLIAQRTELSLPEIGRVLGGRDHTTILAGIRRHAARNALPLPRGMQPPISKTGANHAER